ncbi:hypothetical protein CDL60_17075 [Roseateles noduli]|nr:hypothetical protein CDL60_17075 [Roseateles noduli]
MADTLLGFQRLAQLFDLQPVQPWASLSRAGSRRAQELVEGVELLTWPASYRPTDDFRGHFEFGLKYDRLHFEFLSRLFERIDPSEVLGWISEEPNGSYARRAGFLYEWFTGQRLAIPDLPSSLGYVDALDASLYLTASTPERNRRWRVNDNLPGTPPFCPLVYLGPAQERGWLYDVAAGVQRLDDRFGADMLARSAAWLTYKESRASFAIERESEHEDRIRRFAVAIDQFSGRLDDVMAKGSLLMLQKAVLGDGALRLGTRQSPVFVGQSTLRAQVVHYIAPSESLVPAMLAALREVERRTRGSQPVARAAAVAFGFVYLHPLADGNGRLHRFLINHVLAADKAVPQHLVIPVSATIASSSRDRAAYDTVLEVFSRPFMRAYAERFRFGTRRLCPDGVATDFEFLATEDAAHAWRYPDLSAHARYLGDVLRRTVEVEMPAEAHQLRLHDAARAAVKSFVEMPDAEADRLVRSLRASDWTVSNKLRKEMPELFEAQGRLGHLREPLIDAIREVFADADADADANEKGRLAPAPR